MDGMSAPDVSFEDLVATMPESVREVFPPARWKIGKLWALELRTEPVEVAGADEVDEDEGDIGGHAIGQAR